MEEQKKQRKATEAQEKKGLLRAELNQCKKNKQQLDSEAAQLLQMADNWQHLIEANALRAKETTKKREIEDAEQKVEAIEKKLKLEVE